jgi:tetratricopeptide (TPR) repeat protein
MRTILMPVVALFLLFGPSHGEAGQAASHEFANANKLFSQARYAEALPVYQRLLSSRSGNVSSGAIYTRIGDCYFRLTDYKNAIHAYRSALQYQENPERAATQYWIGFSTFLLGNNADAVAEFLKIPELYPTSGMWVSTAYYWAGRVCEHMGKKDQAAAYYRKAGGTGASTHERFALKKAETVKKGARNR